MELNQDTILAALREEILPQIKEQLDDRDQAAMKYEVLKGKGKDRQDQVPQLQEEIADLRKKITAADLPDKDLKDFGHQLAKKEAELVGLEQWLGAVRGSLRASEKLYQKAQEALDRAVARAFNRVRPKFAAEMNLLLEKATVIINGWQEGGIEFRNEIKLRISYSPLDQDFLTIDSQKSRFIYFGHRCY